MTVLVTGGGGFLGGAIVGRLVAQGLAVRALNRNFYPELEALAVEQVVGDIADPVIVAKAVDGAGTVYHVAAKAGVWGGFDDYYRANVVGTRNVLAACREHRVGRLVFTSSPSVVFDGRDQEGVDESAPYPHRFLAHYPRTKAAAEKLVTAANDERLATVSLRPHLIWGAGDNHLAPRILTRARAGRLRLIGKRPRLVDSVYIDNAVDAHLLAAERLAPGAACAGKTYFITNDEPVFMEDFINGILEAAGLAPINKRLPAALAYALGTLMEWAGKAAGRSEEPQLTRFVAKQLMTAHWFNIDAAKRDLGYRPAISMKEGFALLKRSFG